MLLLGTLASWGSYLLSGWVGTGTPARGHLKIFGRQGREGALPSLYPPVMPNFSGLWSLPHGGGRGLCPTEVGGILLQLRAAASLCGPEAPGLLVLS